MSGVLNLSKNSFKGDLKDSKVEATFILLSAYGINHPLNMYLYVCRLAQFSDFLTKFLCAVNSG